jgi:hypothetical protein
VNGVKVKETTIKPGDIVEMGESKIRYVKFSGNDNAVTIVE